MTYSKGKPDGTYESFEGEPQEIAELILKLQNIANTHTPVVTATSFNIPDDGEEWKK